MSSVTGISNHKMPIVITDEQPITALDELLHGFVQTISFAAGVKNSNVNDIGLH